LPERGDSGFGMGGSKMPWAWKDINGPSGVAVPEKMVVRGIVSSGGGTVLLSLALAGVLGSAFWGGVAVAFCGYLLGGLGILGGLVVHRKGAQTK
jgi:hypothetical protein